MPDRLNGGIDQERMPLDCGNVFQLARFVDIRLKGNDAFDSGRSRQLRINGNRLL